MFQDNKLNCLNHDYTDSEISQIIFFIYNQILYFCKTKFFKVKNMFQYIKNYPKYPFCSFYKISSTCGTFGIHKAIAAAFIPTNPNSDIFFISTQIFVFL